MKQLRLPLINFRLWVITRRIMRLDRIRERLEKRYSELNYRRYLLKL